jgi:hypothetical protein
MTEAIAQGSNRPMSGRTPVQPNVAWTLTAPGLGTSAEPSTSGRGG